MQMCFGKHGAQAFTVLLHNLVVFGLGCWEWTQSLAQAELRVEDGGSIWIAVYEHQASGVLLWLPAVPLVRTLASFFLFPSTLTACFSLFS